MVNEHRVYRVGRARGGDVFGGAVGFAIDETAYFLALAHAQICGGVKTGALLYERAHHRVTQRFGQLAQLGQRGFELDVVDAGQLHRRHHGVEGRWFGFCLHAAGLL